jgi:hypothetical protein
VLHEPPFGGDDEESQREARELAETIGVAIDEDPDCFRETAYRIVELLPDGRLTALEGQDHAASAEVVAPVVAEFVGSAAVTA